MPESATRGPSGVAPRGGSADRPASVERPPAGPSAPVCRPSGPPESPARGSADVAPPGGSVPSAPPASVNPSVSRTDAIAAPPVAPKSVSTRPGVIRVRSVRDTAAHPPVKLRILPAEPTGTIADRGGPPSLAEASPDSRAVESSHNPSVSPSLVRFPCQTVRDPTASEIDTICTAVSYLGCTYQLQQLREKAKGMRILYLYSGPEREMDAVVLGKVLGIEVHAVDVLRHDTHDLADQAIWESITRSCNSGHYSGFMLSPPCGTHSCARTGKDGPGPLRSEEAPGIYGLPHLSIHDKEKVRMGTLLAVRASEIASIANRLSLPYLAETPGLRQGYPSVFKLPEWHATS